MFSAKQKLIFQIFFSFVYFKMYVKPATFYDVSCIVNF